MAVPHKTIIKSITAAICEKKIIVLYLFLIVSSLLHAEDGYELWLRYKPVSDAATLAGYKQKITAVQLNGNSPTLQVIKEELSIALPGLLKSSVPFVSDIKNGSILIGTPSASSTIRTLGIDAKLKAAGEEGYLILSKAINGKSCIVITGNTEKGVLYGVFGFLRLLQTQQSIQSLD